jgi:hypothetical protein
MALGFGTSRVNNPRSRCYCLPLLFCVGILGIPLNALRSLPFYTPLQLLCKGRLDGLLFLNISKDLKFI